MWCLQGILRKEVCTVWCFCGEVVVDCVVKLVSLWSYFYGEKIGHPFQLYFWDALSNAGKAHFAGEG
jgi:hypothetical protein